MNDFVGSFGIQGEIEVPEGVDFDTFCDKFMEAMKILGWRFNGFFEDASSLDIVEVVRCKNCSRWDEMGHTCPNRGWCGLLGEATWGEFYCAQGEWREEES